MAKIRTDYVTNSSSSSFVIAKKNDLTLDDCIQVFSNDYSMNRLIEFVKDEYKYSHYDEYTNEFKALCDKGEFEKAIKLLIPNLAEQLFNMSTSLEVENWLIGATTVSGEDGDLFSTILYCVGDIVDSEKIKATYGD